MKTHALEAPALDHATDEALDLSQVYRRYSPDVMRWATRLTGRPEDAADITQEVFCVVQRKLALFGPGSASLGTWLFRITEKITRARRRKERVYRFLFGERVAPDIACPQAPVDEQLSAKQDAAAVYRALDALSEEDRTVLVLFELEGLSGQQVASLTGTSSANVWVRLHRARKRFAARLAELEVP